MINQKIRGSDDAEGDTITVTQVGLVILTPYETLPACDDTELNEIKYLPETQLKPIWLMTVISLKRYLYQIQSKKRLMMNLT